MTSRDERDYLNSLEVGSLKTLVFIPCPVCFGHDVGAVYSSTLDGKLRTMNILKSLDKRFLYFSLDCVYCTTRLQERTAVVAEVPGLG